MTAETAVLDLLRESVGDDADIGQSAAIDGVYARAIVYPRTAEQVSRLLAAAFERNLKVAPAGLSAFAGYGNPPADLDLIISTRDLNAVLDYSPADLTLTAQAGATVSDVQALLAREGQFLPLETPLPARATLGGAVALAPSGPLRLQYGPVRDWLIGIAAVQANGTPIKSGGKVVKNVTGFDMMKLAAGSLGTLFFLTETSFKLVPLAQTAATLIARFSAANIEHVASIARQIIDAGLMPSAITLLDPVAARRVGVEAGDAAGVVLVELRNTAAAVRRQIDDSSRILRDAGATVDLRGPFALAADAATDPTGDGDGPHSRRMWRAVTDFSYLDVRDGGPPPAFALKAASQPALAYKTWQRLRTHGAAVSHLGVGLTYLIAGATEADTPQSIAQHIAALREAVKPDGVHVVVERVAPEVKRAGLDVWGNTITAGEVALMRRVKQQLDPSRILNPGRYVGGL